MFTKITLVMVTAIFGYNAYSAYEINQHFYETEISSQELAQIIGMTNALQNQIDRLAAEPYGTPQLDTLQNQVEKLSGITDVVPEVNTLQRQVSKLQRQVNALQSQVEKLAGEPTQMIPPNEVP